jgi:hypothetical protein
MGVRFLIAKNHKTDSHHALLCVVLTVKKMTGDITRPIPCYDGDNSANYQILFGKNCNFF